MKSKLTSLFGYLTFILLIIASMVLVFVTIEVFTYEYFKFKDLALLTLFVLLDYFMLHYLIATKFWRIDKIDLDKIKRENEALKMQIEQKKLRNKL